MSAPSAVVRSPVSPVLGAGLVVAAVGGLVWGLTHFGGSASPPAVAGGVDPAEVRGAPIRGVVTPREKQDAANPEDANPAPAPKVQDGYQEIRFAELSGFDYPKSGSMQVARLPAEHGAASSTPPPDAPPSKIPAEVRALDKRKVSITGFMNPIEFDQQGVKSFALTAIPGGCCYGAIPRLNEWIVVTMREGELAEYAYYDPVTIFGEISVGELYDEGVVLSLYRMTPEKVDVGY